MQCPLSVILSLFKQDIRSVPLTGNRINVPRNGYLSYRNNRLLVIVGDVVVRKFRGIKRLFFWTRSNGTRKFKRSTDEFVFGSGMLRIIKYCAYYYSFDIPPQVKHSIYHYNVMFYSAL